MTRKPDLYTTQQAAVIVGVKPDVLRKWKYRGYLHLAPETRVGRSNQMLWTNAAVEEALDWSLKARKGRTRVG